MAKAGFLGRSKWRHDNTQYMLSRLKEETNVTRTKTGKRKLRLFACGCCRLVWDLLPGELRKAVEVAERCADGHIGKTQLEGTRRRVEGMDMNYLSVASPDDEAAYAVAAAAEMAIGTTRPNAFDAAFDVLTTSFPRAGHALDPESRDSIIADLLCCVFGGYVHRSRGWKTWSRGMVLDIAQAIYTDRAFDRLPILADALEEAGCRDEAILSHCRAPGPHARGCWVVDLLLGKE